MGCSNLHSINTFSNVVSDASHSAMITALFTFHPHYSLCVQQLLPFSCFPVSLSTLLLVFPACSEKCLDVLWIVECDSGRCWLSGQPGAGLFCVALSMLSGTGILTSGFRGCELSVATCCAGSSRTPHVEDRVSKKLKTKPSEFILLS